MNPDQKNPTAPLIAICMATYNPDLARFQRQIDSLIAQTHRNWICIISDDGSDEEKSRDMKSILAADERLHFFRWPERVGFYRNFERGLELTPPEAEFIALADQDDVWRPEKLIVSVDAFDAETFLVYSDMRIVREEGELISSTFWNNRRNNSTDLGALLLINCVPGAGAVFRRTLLNLILPFPQTSGHEFHDHWIAVVALAAGKLGFCREPLYDWIQHSSNVIGFIEPVRRPARKVIIELARKFFQNSGRDEARSIYEEHVRKIAMMARTAERRAAASLSGLKRRQLNLVSGLDHSLHSVLWLIGKSLLDWRKMSVLNNTGYYIAFGALGGWLDQLKSPSSAPNRSANVRQAADQAFPNEQRGETRI